MKTFQDIITWQKAYQLTLRVYQCTKSFPRDELFGLTAQLRRASVSIISNIAEGFKRRGVRDSIRFYNQAEASLEEVKCQTLLAFDLGYIQQNQKSDLETLQNEVGKLLAKWIQSQSPFRLNP